MHKQRQKKASRAKAAPMHTVELFAQRWVTETMFHRSEKTRKNTISMLERSVFPTIGSIPIEEVRPAQILDIMEGMRDTPATANRVRAMLERIFNYAIRKLLLTQNPAVAMRGAVVVPPAKNYRPLTVREIPVFLKALDACAGHPGTKLAVRLAMLAVVRKANVAMARWEHFDLEEGEWTIPGRSVGGDGKMKMERDHRVYLSRQAMEVVNSARDLSEGSPWLFPSMYDAKLPLGDTTINHLFARLYALGVASDFKPHGLRSTASTIMNEAGHIRSDVIECILAHVQPGVRGIYNLAEYAEERRQALQWYADRLDAICKGADVIPMVGKAA